MIFGFADHVLDSKPSGRALTTDPLTVTIQPVQDAVRYRDSEGTTMSDEEPLPTGLQLTALDPVFREHPQITSTGCGPRIPSIGTRRCGGCF